MTSPKFKRLICLLIGIFSLGMFTSVQSQRFAQTKDEAQLEIPSKRTANTKTFQLNDGTYRAEVFGGAIHYEDANKHWQDINTSLQTSLDPTYEFENTTNGIKSYFPKTLATHGVKVVNEQGVVEMGNRFTFSYDGSLDAPIGDDIVQIDLNGAVASKPDANVVRYDGGHSLGYIEYLVERNQVKQQFILKQLPAAAANSSAKYFSMSETIDLPEGWSLLADGHPIQGSTSTQGALQIRNAEGKIVSGIPVPEIFEQQAGGSHLNPDGKMEQSYFVHRIAGTNQYQLKISVPMAWLQDPARSFPVVIDPNSVIPGGWGGWIDGGSQTVNGNPSIYVFVGNLSQTDHLAYIQFPTSAIPDSVQIDSVLLGLHLNLQQSSSSTQVLEVNDVKSVYGPYSNAQGQDSSLLADFDNGTYTTFSIGSGTSNGNLPPINLGNQGAADVRLSLCRDTFQLALVNNFQSYKRFSSGLSSIDVYYSTCTGVPPTVVETFHQDLTCATQFGASTVMTTGNNTFYWAHNGDTSGMQTNLPPGNYGVFVNDTSGCGSVLCISILEAQQINTVVTATDATCSGNTNGAASATSSGGTLPYTYVWSNSATTDSIGGLSPASYSVIATDSNGCQDTTSFTIGSPPALTITANNTNASCNGYNDGSGTASAAGGTGTISYAWSSGDLTASASNLLAGTYYVTATDQNGCTIIDSIQVTEPQGFSISVAANNMVTCNGLNDGQAMASATGGSGSFTYLWSNSASTAMVGNLSPGTYSVIITDSVGGCFKSDSVTIAEPAIFSASATVGGDVSCNGMSDGSATVISTGGTGQASYLWSSSDTTASVTTLGAGTYSVIATDSNGCTSTDSVTITEPTALLATTTATDVSCNGLSDGMASASSTGGTGSPSYVWSNSGTTASIMNLAPGSYQVTVTDSNGCMTVDSVNIIEPAAINTAVTQNGHNLSAALNGASYQWLDCNNGFAPLSGETNQTFTAIATGNYAVAITENGCTDTSACTMVTVVGISSPLSASSDFTIFPNPSTGQVVIRMEGELWEPAQMRIFSLEGRLIAEQTISETDTQINLSTLSSGMYVVQFRDRMKKLVIRH